MKSFYMLAVCLVLNISLICAQTIDESYHGAIPVRPAKIKAIKVQPDGRILLGGDITFFKKQTVNNLIRLNADGTLDETFNFNGKRFLQIDKIERQSTGDLVVLAQEYKSPTEVYMYHYSLFLLNDSGKIKKEIDTLFIPNSIAVQSDDKILVCGTKDPRGFLYRYNPDLSPDTAFNNGISFNSGLSDVQFHNDKIFVAGMFTLVNDTLVNNIVRLYPSGAIDNTFNTGQGTPDYAGTITFQPDGKLLFGNSFINSFNGEYCGGLLRLNPDGSVDENFHHPNFNGSVSAITIRDSSIYFSAFKEINSVYGDYLFKLKPDGGMDSSFIPFPIEDGGSYDFHAAFAGNNLMINNSSVSGNIYGLSTLDSVGNFLDTLAPELSRYGIVRYGDYFNGKLVIVGDFIKVDEVFTYGIAMLNEDGTPDESFAQLKNLGSGIEIKILNDTSLLLSTGKAFVKLNSRGQIQPDFNFSRFKTLYQVSKFKVLDNGEIYAADGNNVYRLTSDGKEDTGFSVGSGICCSVSTAFDFDLQDDKVIFGSIFDQFNGEQANKLIRINPQGMLDHSFNIGSGPDNIVSMIKVLDSGEILVGGFFKSFDGKDVPFGLVKLSANGTMDTSFNNNQKNSQMFMMFWNNTKVEQSDTMVYIKAKNVLGEDALISLNINGKFNPYFDMPLTINQINDIVAENGDAPNMKKAKSFGPDYNLSHLFALGNFKQNNIDGLSFIIKLSVGGEAGPTPVPDIKADGSGYQLYPVPVNDKLLISFSELQSHTIISIYDLNGMQHHSSMIVTASGEVDMSEFVPGIYFVRIVTAEGKVSVTKVVKQ